MSIVIGKYEEFTPEIANRTVRDHFAEPIVATELHSIGGETGLMSSVARAHLTLASGRRAVVIVKCAARTDNSALARELGCYRNEVNFFRQLAGRTPIRTPVCLYAAVDPGARDFLLVLEDPGQVTPGDQLTGCTENRLQLACRRAGQLHGMFWGRAGEFGWLNYQIDMKTILFRRDIIFRPGAASAIARFPELFTGNRADLTHRVVRQYIDLFQYGLGGEPTIIHGDYRTDNMFFVQEDGAEDIIVFDWQNATGGAGAHDIACFCSQSADHSLPDAPRMAALRLYHETLIDHGVQGFSLDECVERYRHNLLVAMITPISICGALDQGNERGILLGKTILERSFSAIEAMDCEALLK